MINWLTVASFDRVVVWNEMLSNIEHPNKEKNNGLIYLLLIMDFFLSLFHKKIIIIILYNEMI